MSKLLVLVGPPGSGKSTVAGELVSMGWYRVSQDDQGRKGHVTTFSDYLLTGNPIVVDRMNFSREQRALYIDAARAFGYEIEIRVLHMPYDVCLDRCRNRDNHPTIKSDTNARDALHAFFSKYERPSSDEADTVHFSVPEENLPECIIVDLDGTLCNTEHRQKFMDQKPKNWKSFFAGIPLDPANRWCGDLVNTYYAREKTQVVFCSGRPDDYKKQTVVWLEQHGFNSEFLYMRRRGDFRRDDIVKEIILDFEILPRYRVLFAVDDRQQVVDMWRRRGIIALQCAKGDF